MKLNIFCAALIFACWLQPAAEPQAEKLSPKENIRTYDDAAAYEIFSLILEKQTKDWNDKLIRIFQFTTAGIDVLDRLSIPENFQPAVRDFRNNAKVQWKLQRRFTLSHPYKLVSYDGPPPASEPIPLSDGTVPPPSDAEEEVHSDNAVASGVFSFPAVGFDRAKMHAVVYLEFVCGTLCGGGRVYFLEKSETGWEIKQTGRDWVH